MITPGFYIAVIAVVVGGLIPDLVVSCKMYDNPDLSQDDFKCATRMRAFVENLPMVGLTGGWVFGIEASNTGYCEDRYPNAGEPYPGPCQGRNPGECNYPDCPRAFQMLESAGQSTLNVLCFITSVLGLFNLLAKVCCLKARKRLVDRIGFLVCPTWSPCSPAPISPKPTSS